MKRANNVFKASNDMALSIKLVAAIFVQTLERMWGGEKPYAGSGTVWSPGKKKNAGLLKKTSVGTKLSSLIAVR